MEVEIKATVWKVFAHMMLSLSNALTRLSGVTQARRRVSPGSEQS